MKIRTSRLRLPSSEHMRLQASAADRHASVSELVRRAMLKCVSGEIKLPVKPKSDKETTFQCPYSLYDAFKAEADNANMSVDEALRTAISLSLGGT